MTTRGPRTLLVVTLSLVLGSAVPAAAAAPKADTRRAAPAIARALRAAPASLRAGAAVVDMDDQGRMTELRKGDNGWTCLPRDPGTPVPAPVCLDANGLAWFQAAMAGKEPDPDKVGYSYMLEGGTVWSVLDPAATKLPPGERKHITFPPHIMILNARLAAESGFPSKDAHPDVHRPFVLYGGTPWAMIIIPVR